MLSSLCENEFLLQFILTLVLLYDVSIHLWNCSSNSLPKVVLQHPTSQPILPLTIPKNQIAVWRSLEVHLQETIVLGPQMLSKPAALQGSSEVCKLLETLRRRSQMPPRILTLNPTLAHQAMLLACRQRLELQMVVTVVTRHPQLHLLLCLAFLTRNMSRRRKVDFRRRARPRTTTRTLITAVAQRAIAINVAVTQKNMKRTTRAAR